MSTKYVFFKFRFVGGGGGALQTGSPTLFGEVPLQVGTINNGSSSYCWQWCYSNGCGCASAHPCFDSVCHDQ